MARRSLFAPLLGLLAAVLLAACGESGKPQSDNAAPGSNAISREYRRGPLCVRLLVDRDTVSIAERVQLTIEAEADEGYEAELPRFGEKLGEFGIRDYRDEAPRLTADKKTISRKTYSLEPFLSGDYLIAPMQVRFRKQAGSATEDENGTNRGGSWQHELATEELTIKVNSLLEKDQKTLALNPIKGPVALPARPIPWLVVLVGLGVAGLLGAGAFLLWRRRRGADGRQTGPVLPAHELAYRQLRAILAERLVERGETKLFFSKISDVLRGYIENRFGLQAPRRTTEEFLIDISRDALFSSEHRNLLAAFLRCCDLVKFAEYLPGIDEVTEAIDSCKAFIEATRADVAQGTGEAERGRHGERERGREGEAGTRRGGE